MKTVDDYLAKAPKEKQATLKKLRQTIKVAAPKASESLSYGIVGYKLQRKSVIFFGYWKSQRRHQGPRPRPQELSAEQGHDPVPR